MQQFITFERAILIWPWQISTINQILADSHYTAALTIFDKDGSLVDILLLRLPTQLITVARPLPCALLLLPTAQNAKLSKRNTDIVHCDQACQ